MRVIEVQTFTLRSTTIDVGGRAAKTRASGRRHSREKSTQHASKRPERPVDLCTGSTRDAGGG